MSSVAVDSRPVSILAIAGFWLSIIAFALSMLFTFGPMTMLTVRGDSDLPIPDMELVDKIKYWLMYGGTAALGLVGAVLGYSGVSRGENRPSSDGMAIFAIFTGLLTVIVGAMDLIPMVYPAIEALLSK